MPKTLPTLTAVILAATGALAQEAEPAPQEFESTFTWTEIDTVMPLGEGQETYVFEMFEVSTATEGPLVGLAGRCLGAGTTTDLTTFAGQLTVTCVWQDADGNQLWHSGQGGGDIDSFRGTATWIGGTGRFEGASGEYEWETGFSASPRERVYQGTGTKRGTLILPGS